MALETVRSGGSSARRPRRIRRFTPLRLAIGLVVTCVIAGTVYLTWSLVAASDSYQLKADDHARLAAEHEANRANMEPPWSFREARRAEHHARMNRKWEYASSHPWLPVPPDPPLPD